MEEVVKEKETVAEEAVASPAADGSEKQQAVEN